MKLTSRQRKFLRSLAHHLEPLVKIGKNGLTPQLIQAIDKALEDHELLKIKFIDHKDEKNEIVPKISEATSSHVAGVIGNVAILYRQAKDDDKQKIYLPK